MGNLIILSSILILLYSCQVEGDNHTTFNQDFWDIELVLDQWWRIGCISSSPAPSGSFGVILSSNNGTKLGKGIRNIHPTFSQLLVYDYIIKAIEVGSKNGSVPAQLLPDGTYLHYAAFKLNGSHFIMTDLNGWETAAKTIMQPRNVWNVNVNAVGTALVTCYPRIECFR